MPYSEPLTALEIHASAQQDRSDHHVRRRQLAAVMRRLGPADHDGVLWPYSRACGPSLEEMRMRSREVFEVSRKKVVVFLKDVDGVVDERGYINVRDTYQTEKFDDMYAVGIAAAVTVPWQTPNPVGIPKTGFPTETQAHVAASSIAAQIKGDVPRRHKEFADIKAVCVMDAGNNGVLILADKMLPPRKHGVLIPGPQNHAMKLAFEKYFLWKMKSGHVMLP